MEFLKKKKKKIQINLFAKQKQSQMYKTNLWLQRGKSAVRRIHWEILNTAQEVVTKTIPQKKKYKKATWLSKEALQITEKRKEVKSKGKWEIYTQLKKDFQRITRTEKKAFFNE